MISTMKTPTILAGAACQARFSVWRVVLQPNKLLCDSRLVHSKSVPETKQVECERFFSRLTNGLDSWATRPTKTGLAHRKKGNARVCILTTILKRRHSLNRIPEFSGPAAINGDITGCTNLELISEAKASFRVNRLDTLNRGCHRVEAVVHLLQHYIVL